MTLPIELPILWWNDSQAQLNDLGVRPSVMESGTRLVTFYVIENVAAYNEDGHEYTAIRSGGTEYICTMLYETVVAMIGK